MPLPRTINRNPDFLHVDAVTGPDRTLAIPTRLSVIRDVAFEGLRAKPFLASIAKLLYRVC